MVLAAAAVAAAGGASAAELVARWSMDEAAGAATLAPAAGSLSVALKYGAESGLPGVSGSAVRTPYGGAGQIVGSASLIPETNDFSVFLWVAYTNEPARTTQKHLFSCNAGQVNRCAFAVDMAASPGTLGWWHHEGGGVNGTVVINDGEWHHVGLVRRAGRIELWVDGALDAAASSAYPAVPISQAQDWRVAAGASESAAWSFAGRLDDLRVYHGALSPAEVLALTASFIPALPVHRWRFDEPAGSARFAPDTGWMRAVAARSPQAGSRAVAGAGVRLDGASALRLPASKCLLPATNDFSAFLWVKDEAASAATAQLLSNNALGSSQSNRCSFGVSFNPATSAGRLFFFHPDATLTGATSLRDLGWHHVGLVRRGARMELWLDGDLDACRDYAEPFALSQAVDWRVGAGAAETSDFLTGRIDDLRIYTNALAASEVAALYESYTPTNSLIAHWRFEEAPNVRYIEPSVGWRQILATNGLQTGAQGADGTGVWANAFSRGRILGSKKLVPATNDFTVLLWLKTLNNTVPEKHLFTNNRGQAGRCNLTLDATSGKITWWVNNTLGLVSLGAGTGPVVDDGAWHQVGLSRSGKTFRLWVDGVNVSSATSSYAGVPSVTQSNDWFIASNASDAGAAFYGAVGTGYALLDDLRVYNYALAAGEVSALHSAFLPLPVAPPSAPVTDFAAVEAGSGCVVVGHLPKVSEEAGFHLPSLAVRADGSYVASATVLSSALGVHTKVYRSSDRGGSWTLASHVAPLYAGTVFESGGALYLIGNSSDGGTVVIRRSADGGATWTSPDSAASGLLTTNGGWNFRAGAPAVRDGRLWLYVERRGNTARGAYAANVEAGALSAPASADLLNAANWSLTWPLTPIPESWDTAVNFRGWTDGRAATDKAGTLNLVMRVNRYSDHAEYLALLGAAAPESALTHTGFEDLALFPGGGSAFALRYDAVSRRTWALSNPEGGAAAGLFSSFSLRDWTFHGWVFEPQAGRVQGLFWPDLQVDGEDLVAVFRAVYPDQDGEPASLNEPNFLLFKRIAAFRSLGPDKQAGRLLVADAGSGCVRRYAFGAGGRWLYDDGLNPVFARGVFAGQPLTSPFGLAQAGDTVFVSESVSGGRILAFSARGAFQRVVCTFGAASVPGSLAASGGALYVSDAGSDQVWRVDPQSGAAEVWVAPAGAGYALDEPRGLACDGDGNLYVANREGDAILKFVAGGALAAAFPFDAPEALAWDADAGRLLASVYLTPDLLSIDPLTGASSKLLDNGAGGQRFCGLARAGGSLFFTSDAKNRLNRLSGVSSYTAADLRLSAPGQLLLIPQGANVYPDAQLGTHLWLR